VSKNKSTVIARHHQQPVIAKHHQQPVIARPAGPKQSPYGEALHSRTRLLRSPKGSLAMTGKNLKRGHKKFPPANRGEVLFCPAVTGQYKVYHVLKDCQRKKMLGTIERVFHYVCDGVQSKQITKHLLESLLRLLSFPLAIISVSGMNNNSQAQTVKIYHGLKILSRLKQKVWSPLRELQRFDIKSPSFATGS